jgi:hypothetical protein
LWDFGRDTGEGQSLAYKEEHGVDMGSALKQVPILRIPTYSLCWSSSWNACSPGLGFAHEAVKPAEVK